jgi:hypothetical protein
MTKELKQLHLINVHQQFAYLFIYQQENETEWKYNGKIPAIIYITKEQQKVINLSLA